MGGGEILLLCVVLFDIQFELIIELFGISDILEKRTMGLLASLSRSKFSFHGTRKGIQI